MRRCLNWIRACLTWSHDGGFDWHIFHFTPWLTREYVGWGVEYGID
jgi:hypothetical protein